MTRDCQHGQLARSCDRCADANEIAELRALLADECSRNRVASNACAVLRDQLAAVTVDRDKLRAECDLLIQTLKMARGAVLAERAKAASEAGHD